MSPRTYPTPKSRYQIRCRPWLENGRLRQAFPLAQGGLDLSYETRPALIGVYAREGVRPSTTGRLDVGESAVGIGCSRRPWLAAPDGQQGMIADGRSKRPSGLLRALPPPAAVRHQGCGGKALQCRGYWLLPAQVPGYSRGGNDDTRLMYGLLTHNVGERERDGESNK